MSVWVLAAPAAIASPIDGRGMWIWYVDRSDGGDVATIIARARAAGVKTLYIKAADGSNYWSQFSRSLVRELHAGGLNACAWQYVYGSYPVSEAYEGARAVANGADCLVIDAEAEYEGKYASAQAYITALRASIGYRYPVGLASFPYVDYHPGFPFSVFLGPGGAQYDMPQMYWRDIGSGVDTVFHHTYTHNRVYRRPIYPLGQTDNGAGGTETRWFRGLTVRYGARGISWWDYAWTSADGLWSGISGFYSVVSSVQPLGYPDLGEGSTGDQVVWLQELLARAIPAQRITGTFGAETLADLQSFQARHGLSSTGRTGSATWAALLRLRPVTPSWTGGGSADTGGAGLLGGGASRGMARAPQSAQAAAIAYEIRSEPVRAEAAAIVARHRR
jgi:peptidoglycan hydrolase-like protein with peptidoglycan-binding domain